MEIKKSFTYYVLLTVFLIISVFSIININTSLSKSLLEILIIIISLSTFIMKQRISIEMSVISFFIISYIVFSYIYVVGLKNININDFLVSYKFLFYYVFFSFAAGGKILEKIHIIKLSKIIISIYFFYYLIEKVVNGVYYRPNLIYENNFEIIFILMLFILLSHYSERINYYYLFMTNFIVFSSLSRSGVLELMIVNFFILTRKNKNEKMERKILVYLLLLLLVLFSFLILINRGIDITNIDRYYMFQLFLNDINEWDITNYLFGSPRISYVSENTSRSLRYYSSLFSETNPNRAFSVIYHSFLLRLVYDHGFIGLIITIYLLYIFLKRSILEKYEIFMIILINLINGLSVSSFNNVFFALSILLILISKEGVENKKDFIYSQG